MIEQLMIKRCLVAALILFPILVLAEPLPAHEVFQLSTKAFDPNTLLVTWTIKPGYFLYKDRIQFDTQTNQNIHVGPITYPKAQTKTNRQRQQFLIYRDQLQLSLPILNEHSGETLLNVHFQGCSDEGFCYPPEIQSIKLTIDPQLRLTEAVVEESILDSNEQNPAMVERIAPPIRSQPDDSTDFELLFSSKSWLLIMISFFGFGLLLSFTPCVLPMVPVLSGIIVGHGHNISTRKAFLLSLSYVLSMSITYGVVGAAIALLGSNIQILMQSPWTICLFSLIFVLLALSMFNMYELRLPLSWQNALAKITRTQAGGHYLNAALMGCMSTLILSPCVTAPLIGALGYIAQTGDMILGLLALFFLGMGMGTPLLLIGASAGKLLPKAGSWMNAVKALFGVILIGVAIYLLSRLLPAPLTMALWATLFIFVGVYLKPFNRSDTNQDKLKQGLGILSLTYGLFLLYGASAGHINPLLPLQTTPQPISTKTQSELIVVKTVREAQQALADAKGSNTPVMLDFYADWCASCKVIAATTLQNKTIRQTLQHITVIQVDLTPNNTDSHALLNYFHVVAPPTFLFYNADGEALNQLQLVGDVSVNSLLNRLNKIMSKG